MSASETQLDTQVSSHAPMHVCPHPLAAQSAEDRKAVASSGPMPWHMWGVGALTLIWYALGLGYLGLMESAPQATTMWTKVALALSLCSGFGGAALLLMRSRYAVQAMVVALFGVMAASLEMFVLANDPANIYANPQILALWLIAQVSLFYVLRVNARHMLR